MDVAEMAKMGGLARAKKLSKERRVEIARAAVQARWRRKKKSKKGEEK